MAVIDSLRGVVSDVGIDTAIQTVAPSALVAAALAGARWLRRGLGADPVHAASLQFAVLALGFVAAAITSLTATT